MPVAVYMYNSMSICTDLSIIILPFAVDIPMAGGYTINCKGGVSVAPTVVLFMTEHKGKIAEKRKVGCLL